MIKKHGPVPSILYLILIVSIISLAISSYTLYEFKKTTQPLQGLTVNQLLSKLSAHDELADYKDTVPLNIMKIDSSNLPNLQAQINGLDISFIGNYLIQYSDRLLIYDFEADEITADIPLQTQQQMPPDFFTKLLQHPELEGLEQVQPQGKILDAASLEALKQQFPDIYKDAHAGEYVLIYPNKLIIYNYQQDRIVNSAIIQ